MKKILFKSEEFIISESKVVYSRNAALEYLVNVNAFARLQIPLSLVLRQTVGYSMILSKAHFLLVKAIRDRVVK